MSRTPVWWKLTVHAAPATRELASVALMDRGAGGVIEECDALIAYFPPPEKAAAEAAMADLAAASPDVPPSWQWQREEGEPWRDAWKEHFRPALLSPRVAVCPSWIEPPYFGVGVRVLRLDPGRAFGTGTHETTRLCLRLLDRHLGHGTASRLLDVGCGSGILSVAAARLGVGRVVALDIDPEAASATRENAAANGVQDQVLAICGDLRAITGTYPVVVANILYQILLGLAPGLAARLEPGGVLLLSGLLEPELESAARVYGAHGLSELRREVDGEWAALLLQRP